MMNQDAITIILCCRMMNKLLQKLADDSFGEEDIDRCNEEELRTVARHYHNLAKYLKSTNFSDLIRETSKEAYNKTLVWKLVEYMDEGTAQYVLEAQ